MTQLQPAQAAQPVVPEVELPDPLPALYDLSLRVQKNARRVHAVLSVDKSPGAGEVAALAAVVADLAVLVYANHHYERTILRDLEEDTDDLADELVEVAAGEGGGIPYELGARVLTLLGMLANSLKESLNMATPDQQQKAQAIIAECERAAEELHEYVDDEDEPEGPEEQPEA